MDEIEELLTKFNKRWKMQLVPNDQRGKTILSVKKSNERDSGHCILISSITTRNIPDRIVSKWFLINSKEWLWFLENSTNSQEQETLNYAYFLFE